MNPSWAMLELKNLEALASFHRLNCSTPDCGANLTLLRRTANRLLPYVFPQEKKAAIEILEKANLWY